MYKTWKMLRIVCILFVGLTLFNQASSLKEDISETTEAYSTRIKFQPPLKPILLIPGIGGTKLSKRDFVNGRYEYTKLWVTIDRENYPLLGRFDIDIVYDDSEYGTGGVDYLWSGLLWSQSIYMYTFIQNLKEIGYEPGKNLFAFPYDWRKSLNDETTLERLHIMIEKLNPIVIAHSMGGLLIEEYFRAHPINKIHKFAAVGTPFKGAGGKLLKGFIHGYNFDNPFLSDLVARDIIRESYSAYWLLFNEFMESSPKINDTNSVEYLTENNWIKSSRLIKRTPIKIKDTTVYYVAIKNTSTPFSYYPSTQTFTYVEGDGTVPIDSAFNAEVHGQPLENQILLPRGEHMTMINNLVIDLYSIFFRCVMDGYFKYNNETIFVFERVAYDKNMNEISIRHDLSCEKIYYNKKTYNRIIGNSCSQYHLYEEQQFENIVYKSECVYGNIISRNHTYCNEGYLYNKIKDRCTFIVPSESIGGIIVSTDTSPFEKNVIIIVSAIICSALSIGLIAAVIIIIRMKKQQLEKTEALNMEEEAELVL